MDMGSPGLTVRNWQWGFLHITFRVVHCDVVLCLTCNTSRPSPSDEIAEDAE